MTSSRNPVVSALLQEVQLPDSDRVICEHRGTGRPAEILGLFTGEDELPAASIAQATGLSKAVTTRHLARLVAEGRLIVTAPPASRNRA